MGPDPFGPLLPEQSEDETDEAWGERSDSGHGLDHFLRERPPHHGD